MAYSSRLPLSYSPLSLEFQQRESNHSVVSESSIRVMVVEDFQPFRQFVCSKLEQRPELRLACEVCDGLEAVHKAEEMRPELIVLDIGLPSLNGIEAARRILGITPKSKIIFSSQETSPAIVQEAMKLGAWGYVFKSRAERDLLAAIDAILSGKRFISA
jgi:DNA-binding NarL/FixJ family response regulator